MKIAIVKQNCYQDLYCCKHNASPRTKVLSSLSRVGSSGLFTMFNADMWIVEEEQDKECQIWTEKAITRSLTAYRKLAARHAPYTVRCTDINWGKYDVVISLEVSVPARVTCKYPQVLWCYMISEPYMKHFSGPIVKGYDARLNQSLGGKIAQKFGVVDFPYALIEPRSLLKFVEPTPAPFDREGVFQEPNSAAEKVSYAPLAKFGPIRRIVTKRDSPDHIEGTIRNLSLCKYYVKLGGRKVRGNSILEAIACRNLVVGHQDLLIYSKLLHESLRVKNLKQAAALMESLDANKDQYVKLLTWQENQMSKFAVQRPLQSLKNLMALKSGKPHRS